MALVKELLNRGEDINQIDSLGYNALLAAILEKNFEMAELLIEAGIHVNYVKPATDRLSDDMTALGLAIKKKNLLLVRLLVTRGADLNQSNALGYNHFLSAALTGYVPVLRFFLESGQDINYTAPNGLTALTWAAKKGHQEAVEYLLSQGANPNIPFIGRHPRHWAATQKIKDLLQNYKETSLH